MSNVVNFVSPVVPAEPESASVSAILSVFERQQATAMRLRESTAKERIAKIRKLRDALMANVPAFQAAGEADFRKPPIEVELTEIFPVIVEANEAMRSLRSWMKPRRVWPTRIAFGSRGWIEYQPKGRTLIISPWNYPVTLTLGPLISAIAAGNTAIVKPSEMTPHLSALMGKIIREVFSEDEVALFEGDVAVSESLLNLPFDHIFFTGSPAVGKVVMAAAAKHLTSVTLELGGKSPTVIDKSADLKAAAQAILWAKFTNNGQTCIAPDHILVHADVKDEFVKHCRETLETAYGPEGSAQKSSKLLARVVNRRHTSRLKSLLDDARSRGATVSFGGDVDESQCWISPTLIEGIPEDAKIMNEEIFGPLLPILTFNALDEVVTRINAGPKPLALYIFTRDDRFSQRLIKQTSSGGVCINAAVVQFLHGNLPFGGVNNSGIGRAHGHFGFKEFSHERAVAHPWLNTVAAFYQPHTDFTQRLGRLFIKIS